VDSSIFVVASLIRALIFFSASARVGKTSSTSYWILVAIEEASSAKLIAVSDVS
jgi:hypothetical protein